MTIPNPRVHATTQRIVDDHFAQERPHLLPFPLHPSDALLTVERKHTGKAVFIV